MNAANPPSPEARNELNRNVAAVLAVVLVGLIAGIVLANHATLATRNVRHFEDIAKSVVNPWEA